MTISKAVSRTSSSDLPRNSRGAVHGLQVLGIDLEEPFLVVEGLIKDTIVRLLVTE
jgi:hypothetical protein